MLPYLQVQSCYLLASAIAVLALENWTCRAARLRDRLRLRMLVIGAAIAVPLGAWVLAVRAIDHSHSTYQFAAVALGFYTICVWLPLVAFVRALAKPRDIVLAATALVALAVGQYALWIEPDRIVTRTSEVAFAQWSDGEPVRLVHISDLQTVGEREREHEAARVINELRPDLIVVTGDYVAGPFFDPDPGIAAARAFFTSLVRPRLGIVCVPGHAESERVRERVFEGLDVRYLRNEGLEFDLGDGRRLRLFGTRTQFMGFDLSRFATRHEEGLVSIVASHEPDVSWELEGHGVDLHLAGHTHGGQIVIPFFGPPFTLSSLPREFARGLHAFGDHWLNVNPGIGMEGNHAPRIRFACPPEIDLLFLRGGGAPREASPMPERS